MRPLVTSIVAGAVLAGADALNGHPVEGLMPLVALALVGAGVARQAREPGPEHGGASARTAVVLMCATVIGMTVEIFQGRDGAPFTWLAVLGGAAYFVSSLYAARR